MRTHQSFAEDALLVDGPLAEGWVWTRVSDLSEFGKNAVKTGPFGAILKSKEFVPSGVPILAVGNVQSGQLDLEKAKVDHVTEEKAADLADYRVCTGDVLFTRSGTIGRSAVVPRSAEGWMMSYHLLRVRADHCLVDPQYLHFVFSGCEASLRYTNESVIGTTRPGINTQILDNLPVPLPPRAEQKRIVAKTEELRSHIRSARDRLSRVSMILKRFRQAVLAAACSGRLTEDWREVHRETVEPLLNAIRQKNGKGVSSHSATALDWTIPPSWRWTTLDEIAEVVGGITKGQKRHGNEKLRSVPYLRVANVQRGFLDLAEIKYIEATEQEIADLRLLLGDILFTEGGDRDKLGRGWVWNGEILECIHQNHIFRARLHSDGIQGKLVSWFANLVGQTYFIDQGKQTVNLASINIRKLRAFPVPIPPVNEQEEIVRRVEALFALAEGIEKHFVTASTYCDKLTQSILAKAFRGELVPTEAELARREGREYEPASMLLERIKIQRESTTSRKPERKPKRPRIKIATAKG